MNAARRADGLLPRHGFLRAVELVAAGIGGRNDLVAALQAAQGAPLNLTRNTLDLLVDIGVLEADGNGRLSPSADVDRADDLADLVGRALLRAYLAILGDALPANIFQMDANGSALRVNPAQLPGRDRCYPYALLEFGIFSRNGIADQFWLVDARSVQPLMELICAANTAVPKRLFSLDALKTLQRAREAAGRLAEDWIVRWERRRLRGHPFVKLVRSISDENAAAGFDIISFDSVRGLVHDRFIEVKSYGAEHSFYWSEGEIEAARTHGMRYWLYLVDRAAINAERYEPEMIQDPVSYFIDRDPVGWDVVPKSLKFTRIGAT